MLGVGRDNDGERVRTYSYIPGILGIPITYLSKVGIIHIIHAYIHTRRRQVGSAMAAVEDRSRVVVAEPVDQSVSERISAAPIGISFSFGSYEVFCTRSESGHYLVLRGKSCEATLTRILVSSYTSVGISSIRIHVGIAGDTRGEDWVQPSSSLRRKERKKRGPLRGRL
ncbi:hypothetical protein F4805DRAFT_429354 [Annulohypoxylon moriforme]|nr:hypothetical protein F4805DRAFT_429354 [Annulohypoxylon moriforme]